MKNANLQWVKIIIVRFPFVLLGILASLVTVSGVGRAQVPQTSCSEIWYMPITVTDNNGNSKTLGFGQGLFATNNLDDCDQQAPPPPPSGAFDARLATGSTDYFVDYLPANLPGTVTWLVKYQASTNGDPITLSWSPAVLPGAGTWVLRDSVTHGTLVNVDMRTHSTLVVPFPTLQSLEIVYTTTRCTVTAVASGNWNVPGTWNTNCTGIPAVTDDVYIPAGMTVNFNNTATTVESLTISVGSRLSFSTSNQLLVSDNAFVRGGTMVLGTAGNLAVNGTLTNLGVMQQTKVVNILAGNAPEATQTFLNIGGYGGLTITSNTTNMGSTTVGIVGGQICDTDNTSVWRCFTVTPTNSVSDAVIDFYYAANELHTSACGSMEAWRSTGGRNWVSAGTVGTLSCASEPYLVHYTGVTIASTGAYFSLRSSAAPTAINLRTFNARSAGSTFSTMLAVGLIGFASLSVAAIWWAFRKQKFLL